MFGDVEDSYRRETSQLTCEANQLTGFSVVRVFTERYFQADVNTYPLPMYTIWTKTLLNIDSQNFQANNKSNDA